MNSLLLYMGGNILFTENGPGGGASVIVFCRFLDGPCSTCPTPPSLWPLLSRLAMVIFPHLDPLSLHCFLFLMDGVPATVIAASLAECSSRCHCDRDTHLHSWVFNASRRILTSLMVLMREGLANGIPTGQLTSLTWSFSTMSTSYLVYDIAMPWRQSMYAVLNKTKTYIVHLWSK